MNVRANMYALYSVIYSFERAGWCVVTKTSDSMDFHAGPFTTEDQAREAAVNLARNAINATTEERK